MMITTPSTTTSLALSSSPSMAARVSPPAPSPSSSSSYYTIINTQFLNPSSLSYNRRKTRKPSPQSTTTTAGATTSSQVQDLEQELEATEKVGKRVRVKIPLKVYHVPRVPEVDLTAMVGVIKQYVGLWKGKRISANLPFKVEFFTEVEGRGKVKFSAHLTEDEFEYLD